MTRRFLATRAALHELRCAECRVTWRSWWQRLLGIEAGFRPRREPWPDDRPK